MAIVHPQIKSPGSWTGTDLPLGSITDAGLPTLAKLQNLHTLDLSWTQVTEMGLRTMAKFQNLHSLNLRGTRVMKTAVVKLRKFMPEVEVIR